jgi:pyrimidine operon attenuation protein/uracil phosphoribosyltransferase
MTNEQRRQGDFAIYAARVHRALKRNEGFRTDHAGMLVSFYRDDIIAHGHTKGAHHERVARAIRVKTSLFPTR